MQAQTEKKSSFPQLEQFSNAVQALSAHASPSVVRILVTRFGAQTDGGRADFIASGKQQSIGSGVIIDSAGYIVTNAHVVDGAQKIRVNLVSADDQGFQSVVRHSFARPVDATLVGVFKEGDLALIRIDATGLPTLRFAEYGKLRQGQVVLALGSPEGLENSVSMGIVSSVARQPDPDSPFLFIQTDTPINPGNSGGPLVNTDGEVVGLNTFILSQSGGNESVGFAIPSTLVQWVATQLKKYGHVHRPGIGIGVQAITPTLVNALKLTRTSGVLISDVAPNGPADRAGIRINDILLSLDDRPVDTVPAMLGFFLSPVTGRTINVRVLRGIGELQFQVVPVEAHHDADSLTDLIDPIKSIVPALGIVGITVDDRVAGLAGGLRLNSGVLVLGRVQSPVAVNTGLRQSDVIHTLNGEVVLNVDALKAAVSALKQSDPIALLIERNGQLLYVASESE
ncbi:MAG TPA: trypsin-like peptidase domain-containing protein [Bryobacteraceae bacterium]|jgi:serine protease Do|nr:trypsin-like peptidase domain-containing protein [Bryobacteraceae bacterium]